MCMCVCLRYCVCVCSRTCLLECKCIPQSARPCHSSARPCHPPRIHQDVVHHMSCAFFCRCTRKSQNSRMACDIRESIQWVWFAFLFADISSASSLSLVVFESDTSKLDSSPQLVFMLHENNLKNNPQSRPSPIDSEVLNGVLKFH